MTAERHTGKKAKHRWNRGTICFRNQYDGLQRRSLPPSTVGEAALANNTIFTPWLTDTHLHSGGRVNHALPWSKKHPMVVGKECIWVVHCK